MGIEQSQVTGLRGGVATYVHNAARRGLEQHFHHRRIHARPRRIGNDYIGLAVRFDETCVEQVFDVARKELRVRDVIDLRIHFGIFNRHRHIFQTNDFAGLAGHKIGDGSRARVQVIHEFIAL